MTAAPSLFPTLNPFTGITPGTLLTTIPVTTDTGTIGLAATATAEAVRPLAANIRDVRSARITMTPGASVPFGTQTTAHAEATVTAVLETPAGTIAEVAVTLTAAPSAEVPPSQAEVIGTLELSVLTDLPAPSAGAAPGSRLWAALLHEQLRADSTFADLIETYDGTIGLRIADRELHIRCYRGQVLETTPRSIKGADFLIDLSGAEFVALMTGETNAFMESAMMRRLSSSGSGYEYLRMTTALIRIVDLARTLAAEDGWGYPGAAMPPAATAPASTSAPQNGASA